MSGAARLLLAAAVCALPATTASALDNPASWTRPVAPFNVLGPVDYVGTEGLAAYLIHTPAGAILIDAPMEENSAAVERSIQARGVKLANVKLILLSHAHFDHAGGLAALKKATGARLVVGAGDAEAVATGVPPGETDYGVMRFPAADVDMTVKDKGRVALGGVTLTAVATSGHTPGCTSWRMRVPHDGRMLDLLFACSVTVAGNKLVGNKRYPSIVADFRRSFDRLGTMRADVVLPFHLESTGLMKRVRQGTLVDATVLPRMVADARIAFDAELARQRR